MIGATVKASVFVATLLPLWAVVVCLLALRYGLDWPYLPAYVGIMVAAILCAAHARTGIRDAKRDANSTGSICVVKSTETFGGSVFPVIPYVMVLASAEMEPENIVSLLAALAVVGILHARAGMTLSPDAVPCRTQEI